MIKALKGASATLFGLFVAFGTVSIVSAQSVVQSYSSVSSLEYGQIVQLQSSASNKVEAVTSANMSKMLGVVVNPSSSIITLSGTTSGQQAYISDSGTFPVLVDNENGAIKTGDYISISSLGGIGDKALDSDSTVLGKATSNFNGTTGVISTVSAKDSIGKTTSISIGRVEVSINIGRNPNFQTNSIKGIPSFLQQTSKDVANKPVSAATAYLSLTILVVTLIISGGMLYGGVKTSVLAIGRNPLSKKSIYKALIQVTLTSLIVFIIGIFAVYLLLRF